MLESPDRCPYASGAGGDLNAGVSGSLTDFIQISAMTQRVC
jgi:hypothetical protein